MPKIKVFNNIRIPVQIPICKRRSMHWYHRFDKGINKTWGGGGRRVIGNKKPAKTGYTVIYIFFLSSHSISLNKQLRGSSKVYCQAMALTDNFTCALLIRSVKTLPSLKKFQALSLHE